MKTPKECIVCGKDITTGICIAEKYCDWCEENITGEGSQRKMLFGEIFNICGVCAGFYDNKSWERLIIRIVKR
jgi:hypothetical protein